MWAYGSCGPIDCAPISPRLAAAVVLALWAAQAAAQRPPSPVPCRFDVAPTNVTFTGYTPFGPGAAATSTIRFDCPPPVTRAWIAISAPRVMTSGADSLQFELYREASNSSVWTEAPPVPVAPGMNASVTVHGFLPPQDAAPGSYTTTLVVRIYSEAVGNETDTANLVVQANVAPSCIIDPATLAFGVYDPLAAAPLDAQGTIRIACTRNTAYTVGLGPGGFPSGATRQMANGARRLQYQLYSDAGRTAAWDTTATVGGTTTGIAPLAHVVYGRVFAGQAAVGGAYQDIVQSTINF